MSTKQQVPGFAIAVVREDGRWRCSVMDSAVLGSLDATITEVRALGSTGAAFALLAVDDEFIVVVRPGPGGASLLLSDAAAALDYDVAADVLDMLRVDPPDDDEQLWAEGDLGLLSDLGLPEPEMQVIVDDPDLYPDEQLRMIAQRCGFTAELDRQLDRIQS